MKEHVSVSRFHTRTDRSWLAEAATTPLAPKEITSTFLEWTLKVCKGAHHFVACQRRTVTSPPPLASMLPSVEKAKACDPKAWSSKMYSQSPVCGSQMRTVPSSEDDAIDFPALPLGWATRQFALFPCPVLS